MTYFDHNATTPLLPASRAAWLRAVDEFPGNPSSPHRVGSRADKALQDARQSLAGILGCDVADIVWTSGATESSNMVLHHLARTLPTDRDVWISAVEHPCVLQAARYYLPERHRLVPVGGDGTVDLDWLSRELSDHRPGLIAVMAANNETGILQPWREVAVMCREYEVPYFCDAVQWLGKMPADDLARADFLSGCAHKFGGPKGVGFLKCPRQQTLNPLLHGGPQEEGRRAGTENLAAVLAMMAALEQRQNLIQVEEPKARLAWRQRFEEELLARVPGCVLVGGRVDRLWNTVSVVMPEKDCRFRWVVKLDKAGFAVSTGSACSSGKEEPSHVLAAMGLSVAEAGRVLRLSSGWETAESEWEALLKQLIEINGL